MAPLAGERGVLPRAVRLGRVASSTVATPRPALRDRRRAAVPAALAPSSIRSATSWSSSSCRCSCRSRSSRRSTAWPTAAGGGASPPALVFFIVFVRRRAAGVADGRPRGAAGPHARRRGATPDQQGGAVDQPPVQHEDHDRQDRRPGQDVPGGHREDRRRRRWPGALGDVVGDRVHLPRVHRGALHLLPGGRRPADAADACCSVLPPDRQRMVLRLWDIAIAKTGGYLYSRMLLALLSATSARGSRSRSSASPHRSRSRCSWA